MWSWLSRLVPKRFRKPSGPRALGDAQAPYKYRLPNPAELQPRPNIPRPTSPESVPAQPEPPNPAAVDQAPAAPEPIPAPPARSPRRVASVRPQPTSPKPIPEPPKAPSPAVVNQALTGREDFFLCHTATGTCYPFEKCDCPRQPCKSGGSISKVFHARLPATIDMKDEFGNVVPNSTLIRLKIYDDSPGLPGPSQLHLLTIEGKYINVEDPSPLKVCPAIVLAPSLPYELRARRGTTERIVTKALLMPDLKQFAKRLDLAIVSTRDAADLKRIANATTDAWNLCRKNQIAHGDLCVENLYVELPEDLNRGAVIWFIDIDTLSTNGRPSEFAMATAGHNGYYPQFRQTLNKAREYQTRAQGGVAITDEPAQILITLQTAYAALFPGALGDEEDLLNGNEMQLIYDISNPAVCKALQQDVKDKTLNKRTIPVEYEDKVLPLIKALLAHCASTSAPITQLGELNDQKKFDRIFADISAS